MMFGQKDKAIASPIAQTPRTGPPQESEDNDRTLSLVAHLLAEIYQELQTISNNVNSNTQTIKELKMTFDDLASDFASFQQDFATFATNVSTALSQIGTVGTLNPAQQTILDNVDSGVKQLDATVKNFQFPATPPPVSTTP